ncbi:unnamed protein product [Lasius platythorax]|uniref:Uncharacterized protein n=1 Tax=Lasius platythorax TaxID=488582 RepID=A0AAV2NMQ9_9HYME
MLVRLDRRRIGCPAAAAVGIEAEGQLLERLHSWGGWRPTGSMASGTNLPTLHVNSAPDSSSTLHEEAHLTESRNNFRIARTRDDDRRALNLCMHFAC